MINHLKKIHHVLYSPEALESEEPPFKVTPINEPYLYTDADLYVDTFDNPNQSVKVMVSNVGGGRLDVERISIPRLYGKWIKRAHGSKLTTLTPTSEPIEFELKLFLKALPNPSSVNTAELNVISNSQRKTFSKILLSVHPPDNQSTRLPLPEYLNFGEITVYKILIADNREDAAAPTAEFLLIGDFTLYPPISLEITEKNESSFDAKITTSKGELSYELELQKSGVVMPREKKTGITLKYFQQTIPIPNVKQFRSSTQISTSDSDWFVVPTQIRTEGYDTTDLPVSVNVEKLKPGRNIGELSVADKKISVWAWYKIVKETALTLDKEQPGIHYIEVFREKETPLPIDGASTAEPPQSVMIFEDVDFQFPLAEGDRFGYLMGDFNKWTPRTLLLKKQPKKCPNNFRVTLSLSDGTYLFHAEIDGEMRLDPSRLYEIVCCSHGLASELQVERREKKITLRNRSRRRLKLRIQSLAEWMHVNSNIVRLPSNGQKDFSINLLPESLQPGLNLGWLEIENIGKSKRSLRTPIFVMGVTNGAVPILQNSEIEFPRFEQGSSPGIPLPLEIFGKGKLKGVVQPSTVLRFAEGSLYIQNEEKFKPIEIAPSVHVLSDKPSNAYRKQSNASLITDCYLANRRVLPFTVKYDMIRLIANPPALYFPKVFLFDEPQHTDIMVRRSDSREVIACAVEIPEGLAQMGILKVNNTTHKNNTDLCEFVLDPRALDTAGRLKNTLHLKDEKSGMTLPIQFGADIIESRANIHIESSTQRLRQLDGIPITITNVGEAALRIFEVRFQAQRFDYTPHLTPNLTLLTGESVNLLVKVRKQLRFPFKTLVKDTVIIRLNDSQFPQGIFEQTITSNIRYGIF